MILNWLNMKNVLFSNANAFIKAFELKPLPEVIYFLTDGQISGFTTEDLRNLMPKKRRIIINTI